MSAPVVADAPPWAATIHLRAQHDVSVVQKPVMRDYSPCERSEQEVIKVIEKQKGPRPMAWRLGKRKPMSSLGNAALKGSLPDDCGTLGRAMRDVGPGERIRQIP